MPSHVLLVPTLTPFLGFHLPSTFLPFTLQSSIRGVVDTYDSQDFESSSSSFDMYLQDSASSSEDAEMMDSEDETVNKNNNIFVALGNSDNCEGIGWNTCSRRNCNWICNTQEKQPGCCVPVGDRRPPTINDHLTFDDGLWEGRSTAEGLWRDMGSSCSSAWKDFPSAIDRKIQTRGWNNRSDDWRTQAYNEGARAGMQQVLKEKEKQCFNDSATECIDLGNAAARMIAFKYCHPDLFSSSGGSDYRATCRDVGINQCKGQIFNEVKSECGAPNTMTTSQLQNMCSNKVDELIGDRVDKKFVAED
jgi:hypothetical protein